MFFLYIYAVIQLFGLVIAVKREANREPDANSPSTYYSMLLSAVLFGGLIWTIMNVEPK